jgi:hypothetical protein
MKKLYPYDKFISEGLRDTNGVGLLRSKMTPKSVEDIMNTLDIDPKNILKTMNKIGIREDKFFNYVHDSLPNEKVRDVYLDYISENKEKLHSTNLEITKEVLKSLEDLIYAMNENHNNDSYTSLNSGADEVWDEVTLRLYEELTDEQMKEVIKKAIKNENI